MKCIARFNMMAFRSKPSSFKIQLAEMSKRKQVQSSLNTLFGGKQDRESSTTPTTPAAALIKETSKFQESWKEKYKLAPLWWIRKQNVLHVCKEFPNGKKHALFLRTGANNFQTDSLKGHKVHDASEGHAMSWQQLNMQARDQRRKDPCQLCLLHRADLNTERFYKRQGHAPLKHFVGFLCNGGKPE